MRAMAIAALVWSLWGAMAASVAAAGPDSPVQVMPDRPRIFLRPDELPAWRKRLEQTPDLRTAYVAMRADLMGRSRPHANAWVSSMELQGLALIYLAEDRAPGPLRQTKVWMDALSAETAGDHWGWPLLVKAMSIAYDWLHPDLTPEERQRYGRAIVRYAEATLGYGLREVPAHATWCTQLSDYYNQFYWHYGRVPFAGLALAGESDFNEQANRYLTQSDNWIRNHMLPATSQAGDGGGWFESLGYNQMTAPPIADLLEAWRTATGQDLFAQSRLLPGNAAWVLHSLIPHTGRYVPLDDIRPGHGPGTGTDSIGAMAPLLARRYDDGYAQHFAQTLFPAQYAFNNVPFLLWYDPAVKLVDLNAVEKGRYFPGLGQVNLRSGWGRDDMLAVYRAGRVYGGHGHISPGHFLLYRKGHLLIEDGYYGVMGPEAHNTLYIGGEPRPLARATHQFYQPVLDGTTFDYARITSYAHDPAFALYDWIDSDLSRSYTTQQATRVNRRLVYLRPRTVLLIDRIQSAQPTEMRFRLHAPVAPQIDASRRSANWQAEQGKLYVQTLLPAAVNQQATEGEVSHLYSVTPRQPQTDGLLIHLLFAADLDEPPPQAQLIRRGDRLGAQVTADGATWVVWLQQDGQPTTAAAFQVNTTTPLHHLVADLPAGSYRVSGPAAPDEPITIQSGEPLYFQTPAGGEFQITPIP